MTNAPEPQEKEDHTPAYLAIGITMLVGLVGGALFFYPVPKGNEQLVIQYVTGLLGVWGVAMGFYYQTTKNAAKAQDTMNKQAETAKVAGAALAAAVPAAPGEVKLNPGDEVKVAAVDQPPPQA